MRRTSAAILASAVLSGAFMVSTAEAATFNPCTAKLRVSTSGAKHLVFAVSSSYKSNHVTVTECVKSGKKWKKVRSVAGRAGTKGFAKPGKKREGDGKSPSGSYTLTEAFGKGDPGTRLPYRKLRSSGSCWGSTVGTKRYNKYFTGHCGKNDENLSAIMKSGPYHQAVVIDYNRKPIRQGYGSAIFFHVGGKTPTAGCVSIPESNLRTIMRDLVKNDRMLMGPRSALFK